MAPKRMNADGKICVQRAVDKVGKEFATGLEYTRSSPLASFNYNMSFSDPPTWFLPSRVSSGRLEFISEDGAIKIGRNKGDLFQAYTLMKVNNEADGDTKFKVDSDFFPLLHRMIRKKEDWGSDIKVTGCATFQIGVLEWTEDEHVFITAVITAHEGLVLLSKNNSCSLDCCWFAVSDVYRDPIFLGEKRVWFCLLLPSVGWVFPDFFRLLSLLWMSTRNSFHHFAMCWFGN